MGLGSHHLAPVIALHFCQRVELLVGATEYPTTLGALYVVTERPKKQDQILLGQIAVALGVPVFHLMAIHFVECRPAARAARLDNEEAAASQANGSRSPSPRQG